MKKANLLFVFGLALTALLLTSCFPVTKTPVAIGGSRADGVIQMSFNYGLFESPKVNWEQTQATAKERCINWGYKNAKPLGGAITNCIYRDKSICSRMRVTIPYQCIHNARSNGGETTLMLAVLKGQTESIRELVNAGANVNARDNKGWTALLWAAFLGHTEAIRELVKAGANIEARSDSDRTALVYAAFLGHTEVIRELVKAGANVNASTEYGNTAFDMWQSKHKNHPDFQEISDLLRP